MSRLTCCLLAVLVAVVLLQLSHVTDARPPNRVKAFFPMGCKLCNYNSNKNLRTAAVCNACGQYYGWEFEHCCLCDPFFYGVCRDAVGLDKMKKRAADDLDLDDDKAN